MINTTCDNLLCKEAILDMRFNYTEKINCVYFLIHKEEILYIGSTKDFRGRLKMHLSNSQIYFTSVYKIHVVETCNSTKKLERRYVEKFKPKFNKQWNNDFLNGKNKLWFNYLTHYKSYRELGDICGVDSAVASSVVNKKRKTKDEKYYKVFNHLMALHSTQDYYEKMKS